MKRLIILSLLTLASLPGQLTTFHTFHLMAQAGQAPVAAGSETERVYVTPKGKTYHTHRDCIGLTRSTRVLVASEHTAQVQGLRLCGICAHRHHAKVVDDNGSWAKPEGGK